MHDDVVAVVEREFGEPPSAVRRTDEGLIQETYEVRCGDEEYVVQFSGDHEDLGNPLAHGLGFYRHLRDTEVPVPRVVTERPREYEGRRYAVVKRLPGETGERDVSPDRVRDAGRHLARIHDLDSFEAAGWLSFEDDGVAVHGFDEGSLADRLRRKIRDNADVLRDEGLAGTGDRLESLFEDRAFPASFRPVICHDDYTADNVLFDDGEVTGVIDFDFAHASHGQRDLAKAANGFWMHDPCADWNVRETFYRGYRELRDPGEDFERNEPLYRVETLSGTVASLLEMDELSDDEREFYAERLLAAMDRVTGTKTG